MELLCNQDFVEDIKQLKVHLRIHSNRLKVLKDRENEVLMGVWDGSEYTNEVNQLE